jgi:hypothetical protein
MHATQILVQNDTTAVMYVQVYVENGVFTIIISPQLSLDRTTKVLPGKAASYPVNDDVQNCFGGTGLCYDIDSTRMLQKIRFFSRRDPTRRAIVLHITVPSN